VKVTHLFHNWLIQLGIQDANTPYGVLTYTSQTPHNISNISPFFQSQNRMFFTISTKLSKFSNFYKKMTHLFHNWSLQLGIQDANTPYGVLGLRVNSQ
jgi:predicted nucleic-acid-binding Zn-ribbon protein